MNSRYLDHSNFFTNKDCLAEMMVAGLRWICFSGVFEKDPPFIKAVDINYCGTFGGIQFDHFDALTVSLLKIGIFNLL
jgi:hypothetical protein